MDRFDWDPEKNEKLIKERNISFEEVLAYIEQDRILDIIENPNKRYEDQMVFVIEIDNYAYLVPFVRREGVTFLKTIIPSRKATKQYLRKEDSDDQIEAG